MFIGQKSIVITATVPMANSPVDVSFDIPDRSHPTVDRSDTTTTRVLFFFVDTRDNYYYYQYFCYAERKNIFIIIIVRRKQRGAQLLFFFLSTKRIRQLQLCCSIVKTYHALKIRQYNIIYYYYIGAHSGRQ